MLVKTFAFHFLSVLSYTPWHALRFFSKINVDLNFNRSNTREFALLAFWRITNCYEFRKSVDESALAVSFHSRGITLQTMLSLMKPIPHLSQI